MFQLFQSGIYFLHQPDERNVHRPTHRAQLQHIHFAVAVFTPRDEKLRQPDTFAKLRLAQTRFEASFAQQLPKLRVFGRIMRLCDVVPQRSPSALELVLQSVFE